MLVFLLLLGGIGVGIGVAVSHGHSAPAAASTPSPSVSRRPQAVRALTAKLASVTVELSWQAPAGGAPVDAYNVYRGGALLFTVTAPSTTYTDRSITPGQSYTYDVEAAAAGVFGPPVSTTIQTRELSLSEARVVGDFNVKVKDISHSGFTQVATNFTLGWHFKPKCAEGACDVSWSDLNESTLNATLNLANGVYRGTDSGKFHTLCGHTEVISTLTIAFRVEKASVEDGVWVATRLSGTIDEHEAPQLGCVSSSAVLSITATVV